MAINTKELMKHVRRIRVFTTRLVNENVSGEYHSVFKGQGMEFEEVREYVPGDDIRSVDWNVTARMGRLFIKRFREERELTIIFLVDISGSMCFGSRKHSKSELAAELTSLLALSAIRNQDKVGMVLFSDKIEKFIPPRKGRTAAMRLVREVLAAEETRSRTNIAEALQFLDNIQKRRAIVFLISDFMDSNYESELKIAARRHDLIACPISDPLEHDLPNVGIIEAMDPETGGLILLDTHSKHFLHFFRTRSRAETLAQEAIFKKLNIDILKLSTEHLFIDDVHRFFNLRKHRSARRI